MISRLWWINFALSIIILFLLINTMMIWQNNIIIPGSELSKIKTQWPKPLFIEIPKKDKEQYDTIAEKNLYNTHRKEYNPIPKAENKPFGKTIEPVAKPEVKQEPVLEMIDTLEGTGLSLFGVIIMEDYKVAFINDISGENDGNQIRVKQNDIIGDYTIKRILTEHIIVSYKKKQYKVSLFNKEKDKEKEKSAKKISVTKNKEPEITKQPLILSTKEDLRKSESLGSEEKTDIEDGYEWVILNTPFGEKRIKRKK